MKYEEIECLFNPSSPIMWEPICAITFSIPPCTMRKNRILD